MPLFPIGNPMTRHCTHVIWWCYLVFYVLSFQWFVESMDSLSHIRSRSSVPQETQWRNIPSIFCFSAFLLAAKWNFFLLLIFFSCVRKTANEFLGVTEDNSSCLVKTCLQLWLRVVEEFWHEIICGFLPTILCGFFRICELTCKNYMVFESGHLTNLYFLSQDFQSLLMVLLRIIYFIIDWDWEGLKVFFRQKLEIAMVLWSMATLKFCYSH